MPGMKAPIQPDITAKMISHVAERQRELVDKVKSGLQKVVLAVEGQAKKDCPVDTGRLRSSITSRIEGSTGIVGTTVEYASYVEFGTYKKEARPFLFPAVKQIQARIADFFK